MTEERRPAISGIVLAGGQSSRFGADKSLLVVDGQPLLARVVHRLSVLTEDVVVVTNDAAHYRHLGLPARLVPDERPDVGALMGLYSGLEAVRHPHALAVACDMPFLNLALLRYMLSLAGEYDIVVPRFDGYLEPLHAIYGKACLPAMKDLLARGRRQIVAFFDWVRVRYVVESEIDRYDAAHLSFVNVNTPEDWVQVQELLAGRSD